MKKKKDYLITSTIVLGIFLCLFICKGIFPFGKNSLIWGDMHDQITAFYYHFYDSIKGNSSLLIDFSTSSGINFIGIMAYYILSPFSLIVLLFPRSDIYLVISIIIVLKILLSSLTMLFFIKTYFKKLPSFISIFLAIIYSLCGYVMSTYQITPWMDLVYLFPLLMIGLKKLLDLEKPYMYLITLTISLIFSFYLSFMVIIFIFFASFIYLLSFKEKNEVKKGICVLGINTVLSLLIASFIIVPAYLQISVSSRLGFSLSELLNSKTGPIKDKLSMMMFGGLMYYGLLFFIKDFKKNLKFNLWYIGTCLIVVIPFIIEPVNKIWHFGSYAFFTYRFGFILSFLLVLGAAYQFNKYEFDYKTQPSILKKLFTSIYVLVMCLGIILLTYRFYGVFQENFYKLTISKNIIIIIMITSMLLLSLAANLFVFLYYKKIDKLSIALIGIVMVAHIGCSCFLYFGIDDYQDYLTGEYEDLNKISKTYNEGDLYRVKILNDDFIMNSGMVMKYNTIDHFTSLTDNENQITLKKLGYSSAWVKTFSKGGTLFTDCLLGNKYIMSRQRIIDPNYTYKFKIGNEYFYESDLNLSFGYLVKENTAVMNAKNAFDAQNNIYYGLTGDKDLFKISDEFEFYNIKKKKNFYLVEDDKRFNYIYKDINIEGKKHLYLEILNSIKNNENQVIFNNFNIYINDKLYKENAIIENSNGIIDLGEFENELVNLKIELKFDTEINNLVLGELDLNKLNNFLNNNKSNVSYTFNENTIDIKVKSDKKQLVFVPISYDVGFKATNNGEDAKIVKVFDNYLGINVNKGENNIKITYVPNGLKLFSIISIITIISTIVLFKTKAYNYIIDNSIIQNILYYSYLFAFMAATLIIYVAMIVIFMLSYFIVF